MWVRSQTLQQDTYCAALLRRDGDPPHVVIDDVCPPPPDGSVRELIYGGDAGIAYVRSGHIEYRTPDGRSVAAPGSVLFGNPGDVFSVRHLEECENRRLVCFVHADLVEEIAAACGADRARFRSPVIPPSPEATRLFGLLCKLAAQPAAEADYLLALLEAGLAAPAPPTQRKGEIRPDRRVLAVCRHMDAHFVEPLTLEALASMAGLSRFHFLRLFRDAIGQTPNQYLIQRRLSAAAERLLNSSDPVTRIAYEVGFNDISHFNACFRATFRCAPRALRH